MPHFIRLQLERLDITTQDAHRFAKIFADPVTVLIEAGDKLASVLIGNHPTAQPEHRMAYPRQGGDDGRADSCLKDRIVLTAPECTAPLAAESDDARRVPL